MSKNIKVVWLCHFANAAMTRRLKLRVPLDWRLYHRLRGRRIDCNVPDFAQWITNAIREFENFTEDVELHVVSPYPYLKSSTCYLDFNGVHYHLFRNDDDTVARITWNRLMHKDEGYSRNRKKISRFIEDIKPDIVHLFGAENPNYALSLLDIPDNIPTIAQLQTLMFDPEFINKYPGSPKMLNYMITCEKKVLIRADYIGTKMQKFIPLIFSEVKQNAVIVGTLLVVREDVVDNDETRKEFDFVYFAANINKAADLAVEAFCRAFKQMPGIKLDIIGAYSKDLYALLMDKLKKYGADGAVTFEGMLPTHDDVLRQIRKSRFALLPLKIDLVSGTVREAMANGLPVLTTDTGENGSQILNAVKQTALITPIGDHEALAANMIHLLNDSQLADSLRANGFEESKSWRSNKVVAQDYVKTYKVCLENFHHGVAIPEEFLSKNQ